MKTEAELKRLHAMAKANCDCPVCKPSNFMDTLRNEMTTPSTDKRDALIWFNKIIEVVHRNYDVTDGKEHEERFIETIRAALTQSPPQEVLEATDILKEVCEKLEEERYSQPDDDYQLGVTDGIDKAIAQLSPYVKGE